MKTKPLHIVSMCVSVMMLSAMVILFARAVYRLDASWDTFAYHVPFAALYGRMNVPFQMGESLYQRFLGFPPLPELSQGLLWSITGSLNSIGTVNYLAFCVFLIFCHRALKARFWLVSLIALTSPMVLIHMTVGYIDLFANAFLAIGVCSFVRMFIFDEQNDLSLLLWGMFGLACAAWSKFQLVPLCALFFLLFLFMQMKGACLATQRKYARVVVVLIAILLASAPYGKNAVKYKNPFWPVAIPFLEETFPHMENPRAIMNFQIDPGLRDLSRFSVFFLSLFEVYNGRTPEGTERYNIDQGGRLYGTKAFRMGGFWYVAVVLFNVTLFTMAMLHEKRKGILLLFGAVMVYCLLAFLPQSYELRYYQFLPLSWAALIAMLFTLFSEKYEKIAVLLLAVFVFSFAYMSLVNRTHYRIEKIGYHELAVMNGAERIWKDLVQGKTYCVDRSYPSAFFFTGPTMTEFNIVVRENKEHCPHNGSFIQVAP